MQELKLQIRIWDKNNLFWLQKHLKEHQSLKLRNLFNPELHLNVTNGQKSQFTDQLYSNLDNKF